MSSKNLEKRIESLEWKQPTSLPQSTKDILLLLRALDGVPLSVAEERRIAEMWAKDEPNWVAFHEGRLEKILVPGCGYKLVIHDKPLTDRDGGENVE